MKTYNAKTSLPALGVAVYVKGTICNLVKVNGSLFWKNVSTGIPFDLGAHEWFFYDETHAAFLLGGDSPKEVETLAEDEKDAPADDLKPEKDSEPVVEPVKKPLKVKKGKK